MGAWAIGIFDNDDASDWLSELANANSPDFLSGAIDAVTSMGDYLESPEGSRLLCVCEVIAAIGGQPATNLPDVVFQWTKDHETLDIAALIPIALQAIDRVLGPNSELNQLWQENESEYPLWRETVLSVRDRLRTLAAS
jgi:hypothetical protein